METGKEKAAGAGRPLESAEHNASSLKKRTTKPTKAHRVMAALCHRSLNRFEAAREVSDWCLHSTVATIQGRYGVRVDRRPEKVPGFEGIPTRCVRYWINPDQREKAERVLRGLEK